jgi:hypothetical protein
MSTNNEDKDMSDKLFPDPATTLSRPAHAGVIVDQSVSAVDPQRLMEMAIANGIDASSLEKLSALAVRFEERLAQKALTSALHKFHGLCPVIAKSNTVNTKNGSRAYKFVTFDELKTAIQPILEECGLIFSHSVEENRVICTITHCSGASFESSFPLVAWQGTAMQNDMQKAASAISYAKRYSLFGALGIATADDDARTLNDNPDMNPNAPKAQPRHDRVTADELRTVFSEWQVSNGGGGTKDEFIVWACDLCQKNLPDTSAWTRHDVEACNAAINERFSQ